MALPTMTPAMAWTFRTPAVMSMGRNPGPNRALDRCGHAAYGNLTIHLGNSASRIPSHALLKLQSQGAVIHLLPYQHQLVLAFAIPIAVIDRKALSS